MKIDRLARRRIGAGWVVGLILAALLWSCAAKPDPLKALEQAEKRWQDQRLAGYTLEVRVVNSIWHAQTQTITVRAQQVSASSAVCSPAPMESKSCLVQDFDPQTYTVAGLFAKARAELSGAQAKSIQVSYDVQMGYPLVIAYSNPDVVDGDWRWAVLRFTPLD